MSRHRLTRALVAAASALALAGGVSACGDGNSSSEAAQDAGYRSGDGSLVLIAPEDRDEPVELSGETLDGKTWDSADHRGDVVVVNLWASWCGPCAKEAPELVEVHEATKGDDVEFVGALEVVGDGGPLPLRHRPDGLQPVDEEPVARVGGDASGGGVRRDDQPGVLESGHVVAHGGRGDVELVAIQEGLRADGLGRVDVVLDDGAEHGHPTFVTHGHLLGNSLPRTAGTQST